MMKYEARVKTKFGEIVFNFDSLDELKSAVETIDIDAVSDILSKKIEPVVVREARQPKRGFEDIYQFTPSGLVEPIILPDSKAEKVAFVMFAYHPEPASTEQVAMSTGIKDVSSDYLTHTNYKKFWTRTTDGKYLLTAEGLDWVIEKIVPKVKPVAEPKAQASEKPQD
jgi:hypothetical protein